jgi:seryl-tRNA synthetase
MLEITRIRTDKDSIIEGLKKRNINASETIEKIISTDLNWRNNKTKLEGIAAELNHLAKEIGELFKQGKQQEVNLILKQLQRRIGEIPQELVTQISDLSLQQLESLGEALLDFQTQTDLIDWFELES